MDLVLTIPFKRLTEFGTMGGDCGLKTAMVIPTATLTVENAN